jgi:hypothetical protein
MPALRPVRALVALVRRAAPVVVLALCSPATAADAPPAAPAGPSTSAAAAPSLPAAPTAPASSATGTPLRLVRTVTTGKWPEGVFAAGGEAVVADSGNRRLLRVDVETGKTTAIPVGRLPTVIVQRADGALIALVETDKTIARIDAGAKKARTLARLPDCPDDLAVDGDALFALLWEACSSAGSRVSRVDARTGKRVDGEGLGANAFAIAAAGGLVFVPHRGGVVSVLDAQTLAVKARWNVPDVGMHVAASGAAVFVPSGPDLVRIDALSGATTARAPLPAALRVLRTAGDHVYAALADGRIVVLSAANLMPVEVLVPEGPTFEPRGLAVDGSRLLVTTFKEDPRDVNAAEGRLLVFERGAPAP